MKYTLRILLLLVVLFSQVENGYGQTVPESPADTTKNDIITIDRAKKLTQFLEEGEEVLKFVGDVALHQENVFMYCDSATVVDNDVDATGNVIIQQGDSLTIFSDSLSYEGNEKIAHLFYDVALMKDSQKLFTDYLIYDLNAKRATYYNWAILTNDTTQLRSKRGYFYVDEDVAYFKDSVTIVDPDFELKTDTLKFNTKTGVATFLAPTLINQSDGKIYCEGGSYDTKNKKAHFEGNAQYVKGEEEAEADHMYYDGDTEEITLVGNARFNKDETVANADTIIYSEKTKLTYLIGNAHVEGDQVIDSERIIYNSETESFTTESRSRIIDGPKTLDADNIVSEAKTAIASGNVIWTDTTEEVTIKCEHLNFNKDTEKIIASGKRPLLISLMDGDTLYMSSDTLISYHKERLVGTDTLTGIQTFEKDSTRTMIAYPDVRILKSNLQGIADSVSYSIADSIFEFYKEPIIWSDTSQFTADTLFMLLANDEIDKILMRNRAMIINSPDEIYFNQIKGKNITAFFLDSELRKMKVMGSAESVYYALDDVKAYIGLNKTVCSEMLMYFSNNSIDDIRFYAQPKANTYPMDQVNHTEKRLEGFRWDIDKRPNTLEDLLKVKIKKAPIEKKTDEENAGEEEASIENEEGDATLKLPNAIKELTKKAVEETDKELMDEKVEEVKTGKKDLEEIKNEKKKLTKD